MIAERMAAGEAGHMKLQLPRDEFIKGVETIFKEFNIEQRTSRSLEKAFTNLGQNYEKVDESKLALKEHLNRLVESEVYGDVEYIQRELESSQEPIAMVNRGDEVDWEPRGGEGESDMLN